MPKKRGPRGDNFMSSSTSKMLNRPSKVTTGSLGKNRRRLTKDFKKEQEWKQKIITMQDLQRKPREGTLVERIRARKRENRRRKLAGERLLPRLKVPYPEYQQQRINEKEGVVKQREIDAEEGVRSLQTMLKKSQREYQKKKRKKRDKAKNRKDTHK